MASKRNFSHLFFFTIILTQQYNATGWGMIVWNHVGEVSCAATKLDRMTTEPSVAEALGLRWCLQWAQEQNFGSLVIETDSQGVAKCVNGSLHYANFEPIILDRQEMLANMSNTIVSSIRRNKNLAAHCLVGMARNLGTRTWGRGTVPEPLQSIICKDAFPLFIQ